MGKIAYKEWRPRDATLATVETVNSIITEYQPRGLDLTLRQLYYQFVQRGLIPNSQKEYKKLGRTVSDARLAGLIDWDVIVDRTRSLRGTPHWDNPEVAMEAAAEKFRLDKWTEQPKRIEVWVEKEALIGVVGKICRDLDVDYFACKGYVSQSAQWRGATRYEHYAGNNQDVTMVHLGDHDPSGIDMTRDIADRMRTFGVEVEVDRIALNMDQVRRYSPPPNYAKLSDSRSKDYVREYGDKSWELDALDPATLSDLIRDAVLSRRNGKLWRKAVKEEKRHRNLLAELPKRWDDVVKVLQR